MQANDEIRSGNARAHVSQRFWSRVAEMQKTGKENGRLIFSPVNRMLVLQKKKTPSMSTVHLFSQVARIIDRNMVERVGTIKFQADKV